MKKAATRIGKIPQLFSRWGTIVPICLLSLVAVDLPGQTARQAGMQEFSIKARTDLVTVDAMVRNRHGAIIGNLQGSDFLIYDNNVLQETAHFSMDLLPLAVAIVIDRSPSIGPYLLMLQEAARLALDRLKPEDQVALFAFDREVERLGGLTQDRRRDSTYRRVRSAGLPLALFIPLREPHQSLKIIVYDPAGDLMGSKVVKL